MSSPGELYPKWATALRSIADAIEGGTIERHEAEKLRRIAAMLDGTHHVGELRFHLKRGNMPQGSLGIDRKLEMAKAIYAYREAHGPPLTKAFADRDLQAQFGVGADTLRKAWKDMSPYFRIDEGARDVWLMMRRIAADNPGAVTFKKVGN